MPLEIQVREGDKTFVILPDGEEVEIMYYRRGNGGHTLSFKFPPVVKVYRQELYNRIKREQI